MRRPALAALAAASICATPQAQPALSVCEQAGAEAEQALGVPAGLLIAIGRVESGRWDAALGRAVLWPWATNAEGAGKLHDTKDSAIEAVRQARAAGVSSIDVGCFQVNLAHHPGAFRDLDQAFDPKANALYAAKLLANARLRLGNWDQAVEHYHSANPARGLPYGLAVRGRWTPAAAERAAPGGPVAAFGVKVWTPGMAGPAAAAGGGHVVAMPRASDER